MVNVNIQGPVNFQGRGYVHKLNGHYAPGEFERLTNAGLENGMIKRRPAVKSAPNVQDFFAPVFQGLTRAIGNMSGYTILVGNDGLTGWGLQVAVSSSETVEMFPPRELAKNSYKDAYEIIRNKTYPGKDNLIGFFSYNQRNYWLYSHVIMEDSSYWEEGQPSPFTIELVLYSCQRTPNDHPNDYTLESFGNELGTTILKFDALAVNNFSELKYNNSFIFKDRLWVCMNDGLYFSKATDPKTFTVPDGGFFKFPDVTVNWAVAVRDTIYVACDTAIYTVTYNDDPNQDAVIRQISDSMGATHIAIYRDNPMFSNNEGIFSITSNSYVEKILDNTDLAQQKGAKLVPYNEYLIASFGSDYFDSVFFTPEFRINRYPDHYVGRGVDRYTHSCVGCVKGTGVGRYPAPPEGPTAKSLKHTITNGRVDVTSHKVPAANDPDNIVVDGDQSYRLTYSFRMVIGRVAPFRMEVSVSQFDAGFNQIIDIGGRKSSFYPYTWYSEDSGAGNWQQHSFVFQTAPNARYVRFNWYPVEMDPVDETQPLSPAANYTGFLEWSEFLVEKATRSDQAYPLVPAPDSIYSAFAGPYENIEIATNTLIDRLANYNSIPYHLSQHPEPYRFKTFLLNLEQGTVQVLTAPQWRKDNNQDYIIDVHYNASDSTPDLLLLTGSYLGEAEGSFNRIYFLDDGQDGIWDHDSSWKYIGTDPSDINTGNDFIKVYSTIPVDVVVNNFVPDGNEYMMKKWRNLLIQGVFPKEDFKVGVSYDNQKEWQYTDLVDPDLGSQYEARPHYPHRIGLNQRGNALNIRLTADHADILESEYPATTVGGPFEVSDMRVLWTYIQRARGYQKLDPNP